jgi:hypothetical protein
MSKNKSNGKPTVKTKRGSKPPGGRRATVREILLVQIRTDGDTQPRAEINQDAVDDYAQDMADGVSYPPVDATFDGTHFWLFDGFHRCLAARKAGKTHVRVKAIGGTVEDARWYALGANTAHGIRRTNADKRRSVERALQMRPTWSDNKIAQHVGVSQPFVGKVRGELTYNGYKSDAAADPASRSRTGADDRTIDTGKIGRGRRDGDGGGGGSDGGPGDDRDGVEEESGADDARIATSEPEDNVDPAALDILEARDKKLSRRQLEQLAAVPQAAQFEVAFLIADGQASTVAQAVKQYEDAVNPEVKRDPAGLPLSGDDLAVLGTLALCREALRAAQNFAKTLHQIAIAPAGHLLRQRLSHRGRDPEKLRHYSPDLDQVVATLRFCQPYCSVCPYCHHQHQGRPDKSCKVCRGEGWVTRADFEAAPADYREAVLALKGGAG